MIPPSVIVTAVMKLYLKEVNRWIRKLQKSDMNSGCWATNYERYRRQVIFQVIIPRIQSMLCCAFGAAEPLIKAAWPLFRAGLTIIQSVPRALWRRLLLRPPNVAIRWARLTDRSRLLKWEQPTSAMNLQIIIYRLLENISRMFIDPVSMRIELCS